MDGWAPRERFAEFVAAVILDDKAIHTNGTAIPPQNEYLKMLPTVEYPFGLSSALVVGKLKRVSDGPAKISPSARMAHLLLTFGLRPTVNITMLFLSAPLFRAGRPFPFNLPKPSVLWSSGSEGAISLAVRPALRRLARRVSSGARCQRSRFSKQVSNLRERNPLARNHGGDKIVALGKSVMVVNGF